MDDSDPITTAKPDDFTTVIADGLLAGFEYKLMALLFIIFLIVTSDTFTSRVLSRFNGATTYKYPTSYGTVLQGIFLVFFFALVDIGVKLHVI